MKNKLIICILLGSLLVFAKDAAIMFEKLKGQSILVECPWEKSMSEMFSHFPKQPHFSPFTLNEFLIDTSRVQGPSSYSRYPGIAFDGTNFMAVWMDYSMGGIWGTLISPADNIIGLPFFISSPASQDQPDIVFDGTNYFVVWVIGDNVYGARIKPDGTVLDTNGFVIANNNGNVVYTPAVDYGVGVYLVVWEYGVEDAALVDTNGTVLLAFDLGTNVNWPNVSFNDKDTLFLTIWYQSNGAWGSRILPDGTNLDPGGFQISSGGMIPVPAVDFDGTNWFVVWWSNTGFDAAWVTPEGAPFGEFQLSGSYGMWFPELVLGDSLHWVHGCTASEVDIYATRIDFNGNVLDVPWIPVDTSSGWQAYGGNAYGDSTFIAIWEDQANGNIYARRYAPDGNSLDSTRFPVNLFCNSQYMPAVAFDGTNYLVVYEDRRTENGDIYGVRVAQDGTILDPIGFLIHQNAGEQYWSRVSYSDSLYLVVWSSGAFIYGARILPDGTVLDPNGFQITFSGSDYCPSVSYNNGIFLVSYNHNYGPGFGIWVARVAPDGTVLDPSGVEIEPWPGINQQLWWPELAPHPEGFFVTWNYNAYPGDSSRIDGAIVQADTSSIIVGPTIRISEPGLGYAYHRWHGISGTTEDTFLVVWEKNYQGIYGTLVDSSGAVLSQTPVCTNQPNNREKPSVAFNGKDFLVVWQDARNDSTQYDLFGARILTDGTVLDTNGIELINAEYSRTDVEIASATPDPDTGAQVLLVFKGFVGEPYMSYRALGAFCYPMGIEEWTNQKILPENGIDIYPSISYMKPFALNYSLSNRSEITVNVFDITGRLVKNVYNGRIMGMGEIKFTLDDIPQGVYFVRVDADNKTETTKIIWLR